MQQQRIEINSVVSWSAEAVATDVNDEVVLMSMERNRCYGLGTTGSEIWRKLGNPIRVTSGNRAEKWMTLQIARQIIEAEHNVADLAGFICYTGLGGRPQRAKRWIAGRRLGGVPAVLVQPGFERGES